ncbi:MAG TPA: potassium channel protein [Methylothermaceae bacterium]|nr:potassium channel protein [Methylothermaceae bacterium]
MPVESRPAVNPVVFIVLREMRTPILVLICVYAVAIFGMALIPGRDGEPMSIFHAFYFVMYTATTTGFGEIPDEFSDAQRMWAIFCLFVTVVTWLYSIGAIIRLLQNRFFQLAREEWHFTKAVRRIGAEYYILCGFGDTGSLLARGLSDAGIPAAVLDKDQDRIRALQLRDYSVPMPGLCCDASVPRFLIDAGVQSPRCKGVIALTHDEEVNLKIAAVSRLLNPNIKIIAVSASQFHEETLATLGRDTHFVDPFKVFAKGLGSAIVNPALYILNEWLVHARGASLEKRLQLPPPGRWIICGYGRMGREVYRTLHNLGVETAVIDPHPPEEEIDIYIRGRATAKTLKAAGVRKAVGVVAANDDDGHNLSIIINARGLNPGVFMVVRQNRHQNEVAFNAANVDIIMQPSLVTARNILFRLTAPLLRTFFSFLVRKHRYDVQFMERFLARLRQTIGDEPPQLLTLHLQPDKAAALTRAWSEGAEIRLGDILRDPRQREERLPIVPFVLHTADDAIMFLPEEDVLLKPGDELLLCGTDAALRLLDATLNNDYMLFYVVTGRDLPRGWLMQWLFRRIWGEEALRWPRQQAVV